MSRAILEFGRLTGALYNFKVPGLCLRVGQTHSIYAFRNINLTVCRYAFHRREVNQRAEDRLKRLDKIPDEYSIIYRAPLYNYVKTTYSLGFMSVVGVPALWSISLASGVSPNFSTKIMGMPLVGSYYELCGFLLGLAVINALIAATVFSYPLRIYVNPEKGHYIVVYQHTLPWKLESEEFSAGELKACHSYWVPWKDSLYQFRNRKAVLLEEHFRRPVDFHDMFLPVQSEKSEKG